MKKIILSILILFVSMFVLVGCGDKTPAQTEKTPVETEEEKTPVETEEEKTPVETAEPTPEPGETEKTPVTTPEPTPTPTETEIEYGSVIYNELTEATAAEALKCFEFFWETQNTNTASKGFGLIPDRYPNNGLASIASLGYGLTAIPIGILNGWITYEEGYRRVYDTLVSVKRLDKVEGFFYHFYNYTTGNVATGSEVSNIDTAIFLCGALFAGQYFGGDIQKLAQEHYDEVNWPWYINPATKQFYMSYKPGEGHKGAWDVYGEQLMMYFLAAGSSTHPIDSSVYYAFRRVRGSYGKYNFINSWFGSIFTYQFSHAWIDFRNMVDGDGINWYNNSVKATYANYEYCVDWSTTYKTFSKTSWGLTACDGPDGYNGLYGSAPSGTDNTAHRTDGTVALCGAIGSIVFAPEIVVPTIDYYYTALEGDLFDEDGYGFVDSYNLDDPAYRYGWVANDVIGIDKGISLLMIENYRTEFVWQVFMDCEFMQTAIEVLEFTETK